MINGLEYMPTVFLLFYSFLLHSSSTYIPLTVSILAFMIVDQQKTWQQGKGHPKIQMVNGTSEKMKAG